MLVFQEDEEKRSLSPDHYASFFHLFHQILQGYIHTETLRIHNGANGVIFLPFLQGKDVFQGCIFLRRFLIPCGSFRVQGGGGNSRNRRMRANN